MTVDYYNQNKRFLKVIEVSAAVFLGSFPAVVF